MQAAQHSKMLHALCECRHQMCRLDLCMTLVQLLQQSEVVLRVQQEMLHAAQFDDSRNRHQLCRLVTVKSFDICDVKDVCVYINTCTVCTHTCVAMYSLMR